MLFEPHQAAADAAAGVQHTSSAGGGGRVCLAVLLAVLLERPWDTRVAGRSRCLAESPTQLLMDESIVLDS